MLCIGAIANSTATKPRNFIFISSALRPDLKTRAYRVINCAWQKSRAGGSTLVDTHRSKRTATADPVADQGAIAIIRDSTSVILADAGIHPRSRILAIKRIASRVSYAAERWVPAFARTMGFFPSAECALAR